MVTPTRSCVVPRHGVPLALLLVLAAIGTGCQGDGLTPATLANQNELYWTLDLNHHAVMLSTVPPYDTLTLIATPRNSQGEPLPVTSPPIFTSNDIEHVVVTPAGVLRALAPLAPGTRVQVNVTLTMNNLKSTDSVMIAVTDTSSPPVLASFSVHPLPPDSAKAPVRAPFTPWFVQPSVLRVRAADTAGTPIIDLPVSFRSSDVSTATIDEVTGEVSGLRPGTLKFYATTTAFGITKTDTLPYRIGWPVAAQIDIRKRDGATIFEPAEIRVGAGAFIWWWPNDGVDSATDIVFTNPAPVATAGSASGLLLTWFIDIFCTYHIDCNTPGNIGPFGWNESTHIGARAFPVAGTYDYGSPLQGGSGRIIVVDER